MAHAICAPIAERRPGAANAISKKEAGTGVISGSGFFFIVMASKAKAKRVRTIVLTPKDSEPAIRHLREICALLTKAFCPVGF